MIQTDFHGDKDNMNCLLASVIFTELWDSTVQSKRRFSALPYSQINPPARLGSRETYQCKQNFRPESMAPKN